MEIKIDPKDVEKAVADAILKSSLGGHIQKALESALGTSWNSPVEQAVKQEVYRIVANIVSAEYEPKIREAVKVQLTDELVQRVATAAMKSLLEKL